MDTNGHGSNDLNERAKKTRNTAAGGGLGGGGIGALTAAAVDPTLLAALASQDPSTLAAVAAAIAQMNSAASSNAASNSSSAAAAETAVRPPPTTTVMKDSNSAVSTTGTLNSTAPVSSLLPPIPAPPPIATHTAAPTFQQHSNHAQQQQQQQSMASLHEQLAALLGVAAAAAPPSPQPPPLPPPPPAVVDTHHHHKVRRTGGPSHAFHHHHHHNHHQAQQPPPAVIATTAAAAAVPTTVAAVGGGGGGGTQFTSSQQHGTTRAATTTTTAPRRMQIVSKPRAKPAATSATSIPTPVPLTSMQTWTLAQLENHAKMYTQMGQPVPQSVSLVLEGAHRKEQKKNAKREANRRSASSSRARKKALMEEMAELNVRLRRQALILALLPDLVIVIDPRGVISFCSAQVQNILRHCADDLVGAQLTDLLVPASKAKLLLLIKQLVDSQGAIPTPTEASLALAAAPDGDAAQKAIRKGNVKQGPTKQKNVGMGNENAAAMEEVKPADSTAAARDDDVADSSFPLPEVKFKNKSGMSDENDNSDGSRSKEPSSLTASAEIDNSDNSANSARKERSAPTCLPRSPTGSSLGNSGSDDGKGGGEVAEPKENASENAVAKGSSGKVAPHSSDTSNTSSLSTTAKKLQKANANLERNVRWHNKKMKSGQTANNATARLSSLQHRSESSSSEEDDSGYRESNDSREETTSSSTSDTDDSNGRRKPLAPTCNICLIRKDLTTIWCEVTSSIRRKEPGQDSEESMSVEVQKPAANRTTTTKEQSEVETLAESTEGSVELLLCLRPIRDGEQKVDEKLRFEPGASRQIVSESSSGPCSGEASGPSSDENLTQARSSKYGEKRVLSSRSDSPSKKRRRGEAANDGKTGRFDEDAARSTEAVESLMLMNRKNT